MKYQYIVPVVLTLTACSGSPGSSDIQKSLTSELAESCPYANISNVKTNNIISPDSNNNNIKEVSFSADVQVKFIGEVANRWRGIERAKELYLEHHDKLSKASDRSYRFESEQSKKYADMSNGVLKLTPIGLEENNLSRLIEPRHVNMPDGCVSFNKNTIIGIITQEALKGRKDDGWAPFIDGVSVGVEAKRTMVKGSNGWVFR